MNFTLTKALIFASLLLLGVFWQFPSNVIAYSSVEECQALPETTQAQKEEEDGCFKEIALAQDNRALCKEPYSTEAGWRCAVNFQFRDMFTDLCVQKHSLPREECRKLTLQCGEVSYIGEDAFNSCFDTVARNTGNAQWCETANCINTLSIQRGAPESCDALGELRNQKGYLERDWCKRQMAWDLDDPSICSTIGDELRGSCYGNFVRQGEHGELCELLPSLPRKNDFRELRYPVTPLFLPLPSIFNDSHASLSQAGFSVDITAREGCYFVSGLKPVRGKSLAAYSLLIALIPILIFAVIGSMRRKVGLKALLIPAAMWTFYAFLYVPGFFRDVPWFYTLLYNVYVLSFYMILPTLYGAYVRQLQQKKEVAENR